MNRLGRALALHGAVALALLAFASGATAAEEEGKSGVSASRLKLPKGPGSIEGIGENAEPDVNMGLVRYGVKIDLPPGYGGFGPALRLAYSSGAGNSAVGLGWSVEAPRIERMTSKGLPRYDATDLFAANGGEELVPVGSHVYRARYEGAFVRYTWVDTLGDGRGGYWKAEYPDGKVGYFGADSTGASDASARTESTGIGTFGWALVDMVDTLGHHVRYGYSKDSGQSYLDAVEWVFGSSGARYRAELGYEARPDALSDGKPGFLVTTAQRLAQIRVLVHGQLRRRYALQYEDEATSGGLSRLTGVTQYGSDDVTAYPVLERFEYLGTFDPTCASQTTCALPYLTTLGSTGVSFQTGRADLTDINGDGLPDVVDTTDGVHVFHVATMTAEGVHAFQAPRYSTVANGGSVNLSSPYVQAVDLDGNGFTDLVDQANHVVLWNDGTGEWRRESVANTNLPDFATDPDLRFFDFDNDRAIDVVHDDGDNTWYYHNRGDGTFDAAAIAGEPLGWGFTRDGAQLADMNGDGMADLVLVSLGVVSYRPNLGRGVFGPVQEMYGLPTSLAPEDVHLVDIDGDSLADAVVVLATEVRYALNRHGASYDALQTVAQVDGGSIPEVDATMAVRFADMNGNGSTDVVWVDQSGLVTYLELYPHRANLLSQVSNGIGRVITLGYGTGVQHMALDGGPDAWAYRLPQPMTTLDSIDTYDTHSGVHQVRTLRYHDGYYDGFEKQFRGFRDVEVDSPGDDSSEAGEARYTFEVGQDDPYRKGLLLRIVQTSAGKVLTDSETTYDECEVAGVGTPVPAVRYVCKTVDVQTIEERTTAAEWVQTRTQYEHDGYGNVTLTAKLGVTSVGGNACAPCTYDPTAEQGPACGAECLGDESYERVEYVSPVNTGGRWLLRAPYRKQAYGMAGGPTTEELTYYDGTPFVGLPLGQLTEGLAARVTQRISSTNADVASTATGYDADGNPVEVQDPNGHRRLFTYDSTDALLLVAEEIVLDDPGHPAYALRMDAQYDPVHEGITAATQWQLYEGESTVSAPGWTRYEYDVFGRLTKIASPGDDLAVPTKELAYDLADPVSRIIERTRSVAGQPADLERVQCFDGLGRKYQTLDRIDGEHYQADGYKDFDAHAREWATYQPYVRTSDNCEVMPPAAVLAAYSTFDATGRVLSVTYPDASVFGESSVERNVYLPLSVVAYDAEDTDASSPHRDTPSTTLSDGLGRSVAVERLLTPTGPPVEALFYYDMLGRLARVVDDAANSRAYSYDLAGHLTQIVDPDAGTITLDYDDAGNRVRETDARGTVVRWSYDEANRMLAEWDDANEAPTNVQYTYDRITDCLSCTNAAGHLAAVSYPVEDGVHSASRGVDLYGYDARGRPAYTGRQLWGVVIDFVQSFDNADRPTEVVYPGGLDFVRELDGLGREVSIPGYVDAVTYTARNQRDELDLANGVRTFSAYDPRMRLSGLLTLGAGSMVVQDHAYDHDRTGNLVEVRDGRIVEEPTAAARYGYDALYRLTKADLDVGRPAAESLSITLDSTDNILSMTSSLGESSRGHVGTYAYGQNGAGPHAVSQAGAWQYRYDAAGNMIQHGSDSLAWDHVGRLVEVRRGSEVIERYAYGAGRDRVLKREGALVSLYLGPDLDVRDGVVTAYARVGGERVFKVETPYQGTPLLPDVAPISAADGVLTAADAYVAAREGRSAAIVRALLSTAARLAELQGGPRVTYLHHDQLGSDTAGTDESGDVLQRTVNYPYGEVRFNSGYLEDYSWTGQERDQRVGLSYHSARYLDTRIGRWLIPDPFFLKNPEKGIESPLELNLYSYALNNPVSIVDPSGTYGRGGGFSDEQWGRFNAAQQQAGAQLSDAADRIDRALSGAATDKEIAALEEEFAPTFGTDSASPGNLRGIATKMRGMAEALRDDGSNGYMANGRSPEQWKNEDKRNPNAAAAGEVGGKSMWVNVEHPLLKDGGIFGFVVGHESAHNIGLSHAVVDGQTCYMMGSEGQRRAFKNLPRADPAAALHNPDSIMHFAWPEVTAPPL